MTIITIHESGHGAHKLRINSYSNGWGYAVTFGEAGSSMRTLWFQDESASTLRDEFDAMETARPDDATRDVWLEALDPYL